MDAASLSTQQQASVMRRVLQDTYRASLFHLCKYGLGYSDITWRTHGGIIRALEAQTERKLICVPRGCFKSSITAVGYPIWRLIQNPNLRILIDSELYSNSTTFLREIRAHLTGRAMTSVFGSFIGPVWNEGEITLAHRQVPKKEASITCGGIGTTKVGQHYDLIIGDDYNSPANTATPERRKKVLDHIRYNISILEPGGVYVFTATRYHEEDTTGFILRDLMGLTIEEALQQSLAA